MDVLPSTAAYADGLVVFVCLNSCLGYSTLECARKERGATSVNRSCRPLKTWREVSRSY